MKTSKMLGTGLSMGILALSVLWAGTGEAKGRREGINFGLGLKVLDQSSIQASSKHSDSRGQQTGSAKHFSPYLGYAAGKSLNLGVTFLFETKESQDRFKLSQNNQELQSDRSTSLKSGSLFARFMFAGFMYFEGGFGAYEVKESSETIVRVLNDNGDFSGTKETSSRQGVGPGYHFAVGAELSITNGFYFSSAYIYRSFTTFAKEGETVGSKKSAGEKRELTFGLTYYQG